MHADLHSGVSDHSAEEQTPGLHTECLHET